MNSWKLQRKGGGREVQMLVTLKIRLLELNESSDSEAQGQTGSVQKPTGQLGNSSRRARFLKSESRGA